VEVTGLVFVGTRTRHVAQMRSFVQDVLGLAPREDERATFFDLPDGSSFAVTEPADLDPGERTVGFLVTDVAAAARELAARGVPVGEVADNGRQRYVHFRAPDSRLYELVEERGDPQSP
jgi:catechol 2,3-dioxygenase-like lactoylglutathione lyase family enzyme